VTKHEAISFRKPSLFCRVFGSFFNVLRAVKTRSQVELVTVALTIMNGLMYFFWWDKPLGHIASRRPRTTKQVYSRRVKARPQYRHFFNALTLDWTSNDASSASRIPLNAVTVSSRGSDPYSFHCLRISAWPLLLVVRKYPPSVVKLPPSLLQISTNSSKTSTTSCTRTSRAKQRLRRNFPLPSSGPLYQEMVSM